MADNKPVELRKWVFTQGVTTMKTDQPEPKDIHPWMFNGTTVCCACGEVTPVAANEEETFIWLKTLWFYPVPGGYVYYECHRDIIG